MLGPLTTTSHDRRADPIAAIEAQAITAASLSPSRIGDAYVDCADGDTLRARWIDGEMEYTLGPLAISREDAVQFIANGEHVQMLREVARRCAKRGDQPTASRALARAEDITRSRT